jgi:hypothetical protein
MKRQRSQATQSRNQELLGILAPIRTDHPLWGYRRIWRISNTAKDTRSGLTASIASGKRTISSLRLNNDYGPDGNHSDPNPVTIALITSGALI